MRRNCCKQVKTIVVLDHHRQSSEIIDNAVLVLCRAVCVFGL